MNKTYLPSLPRLGLKKIKHQQGITYIEIMIVVVILGIIAAVAMPNLSSTDHKKLDIAAAKIAEVIRFSRAESIRTAIPHGVILDKDSDTFKVYWLDSIKILITLWIKKYDVYHPLDKKIYTLDLKTDKQVAGVDLLSYSIHYGSLPINHDYIGFNSDGNPKTSVSSTDYMLNGTATITIAYAGKTRVISISPMTGRVTVQ